LGIDPITTITATAIRSRSGEGFVFCAPTALNIGAKGNALEQSHRTHRPSPEKGETTR
jgi:hypothetical protein